MNKVSQKGALEKTNLREEVQEKMNKVDMNDIIKLNVGGKLYATRRRTLLADQKSMLANMFSAEYQYSKESDGSYFIDRDGKHFRLILNYLRNGVLPDEVLSEFGSELYPEAVFYGLTGLMQQITEITTQKGNQIPVAKPVGLSSAAVPVKYPE